MKSVTFQIKTIFPISDDELTEELLLAETRMNAESKVRFHLQEYPSKIECLENKIEAYKFICTLAEVPKFIIDNPEVFKPAPLTKEDKKWAKKKIKEYKASK